MLADHPLWLPLLRAARTWGIAGLGIVVVGLMIADWAAARFAPATLGSDDIITGSITPKRPERSVRVIRSVLSEEPIVIRK